MRNPVILATALAILLLVCVPVHGQALPQPSADLPPQPSEQARRSVADAPDVAALKRLAAAYEAERAWTDAALAWARVAQLRPQHPDHRLRLAAALAQAGDLTNTYNTLLVLQRTGAGYDLAADPRFTKVRGTEVWEFLVKLLAGALREPFGEGEVAFELSPADLLLESIVHDPRSDAFLFGSARDGVIYRRDSEGELQPFAQPQGDQWWSIFDLKLDPGGRFLWATTAAVPHFKGFEPALTGRSALLKINLANGELVQAFPAPDDGLPHILNTIAVSSKGLVVVAEGMRGQLFKLEGDALQPMMAERRLNALRGMAFSADDRVLYFADYEMGLFGIQMNAGRAFDVKSPENLLLAGIEGLYQYEGQLVAIQNGFKPHRVMRLKLAEDGRSIEQGVPLEAAQPAFATPTLGTLVGSELHYLANSQRDYYDGFGLRRTNRTLPPVKVFRTDVRFNWDYAPPRLPSGVLPEPPVAPEGD